MSDFPNQALIANMTDEEFMQAAYLRGLSKLEGIWVEEFYKRLALAMDEKDALGGAKYAEKVINADYIRGYTDGQNS